MLAIAVSRIDNLEFLADVIPKTTTYKQFKENKAKEVAKSNPAKEKGQRTLNGNIPLHNKTNGESAEAEAEAEKQPSSRPGTGHGPASLSALMTDDVPESSSARLPGEDVEMTE